MEAPIKVRERQQRILSQLETHQSQSYERLGEMLGVSTMTVRRDVEQLARRGAVIKTLGGAQKAGAPSLYETGLVSRLRENLAQKQAIAGTALELIGECRTLYLDGGTTCVELAKLIAQTQKELTVVTNSALVCVEVGQNHNNIAVAIGGQYDADSLSFVGPASEEEAGRFHVELAFLSTKAVVPGESTFESTMSLIRIKKIIARQSGHLVLLADSSKFGQRALRKALDITNFGTVVTDAGVDPGDVEALRRAGCEVRVASVHAPYGKAGYGEAGHGEADSDREQEIENGGRRSSRGTALLPSR